ncbi:MAG: hypothetical protein KDC35_05240 [Acidobacteria bacterium]|nr:hypothetical protein [Acidobacteriota bacterium]
MNDQRKVLGVPLTLLPLKGMAWLTAAWLVVAFCNMVVRNSGIETHLPYYFPISVFIGPEFHGTGIPYLVGFLALAVWSLDRVGRWRPTTVLLVGLLLIVLGNLGQGSWREGFIDPFVETTIQYYHDAVDIRDGREWLKSFNQHQVSLQTHGRTHPPFAVLVHYWHLGVSSNLYVFSLLFLVWSASAFVWFWWLLKCLGVARERCHQLTLLFCLVPAVNIYVGISLDGVILSFMTMYLAGLAGVINGRHLGWSTLWMVVGCIGANLLTFLGLFLIAVTGIVVAIQVWRSHDSRLGMPFLWVLGSMFLVLALLDVRFGYNHLEAFLTASAIENPRGLLLIHEPWVYLASRFEGLFEMGLFLSFALLASWKQASTPNTPARSLIIAGTGAFALFLLAGVYRTGETARAALFIYPYLLLRWTETDETHLKAAALLCGLQTACMQLLGNYFW